MGSVHPPVYPLNPWHVHEGTAVVLCVICICIIIVLAGFYAQNEVCIDLCGMGFTENGLSRRYLLVTAISNLDHFSLMVLDLVTSGNSIIIPCHPILHPSACEL